MEKWVYNVLNWYQKNKRDLPWRKDKNPYHIWISEIMLQQTRIEAVIGYYDKLMKELPTIESLAKVKDEKLLKLWEGLGYYHRAKNLKKTAQIIVEKYQGKFPMTYEEWIKLPGIGSYTASAISSICFQEKKATVDGNVLRVYMRYYNQYDNISIEKTKKKVKEHLESIMPEETGDFNEGLMELGEVICVPKGIPLCNQCPIQHSCLAKQYHTYLSLPTKKKNKDKKKLHYTVLLLKYQGKVAISKRIHQNLLNDLWEFPNIEGKYSLSDIQLDLENNHIKYKSIQKSISYTHIFTHQKWKMEAYQIELKKEYQKENIVFEEIKTIQEKYALPTAFQPFLKSLLD